MAQVDSNTHAIKDLPGKYFLQVDKKIEQYNNRISSKTEKTLTKLSRWENKIRGLLEKASPKTAARLFANKEMTFSGLLEKYHSGQSVADGYKAEYNEYRDKLTTGLKYIETQKALLDTSLLKPLKKITRQMDELEGSVADAEATEKFIKERKKQLINESIKYIGKSRYLQKINKETYYYAETLKNYKELFSDPKKAEAKAKELLNKLPAFQKFMRKNSMLASMFGSPEDYGTAQSLAGLQTRASVNDLISQRLASGGPNARAVFSQNLQDAQSQLNALKDKVLKAGGTSSDANIPDFKPNNQKTKTFMQRLEFGFNYQFEKTNAYMPNTVNTALTVGYKLNDKSVIGVGAAYKMGMGSIQKIHITHQGIGIRTYLDWKLKKQFFASGGFEMNHNAGFKNIDALKSYDAWQMSGLVGISKKISVKTKLTKGTKVQLMYDMLYREHVPASKPFVLRVGYEF